MVPEKESAKQAKMPVRPAEAMANKAKGKSSSTPALSDNTAAHVPVRGESPVATKGKHSDGLASMAKMGTESRVPVVAPSHRNSDGKPGMKMGG